MGAPNVELTGNSCFQADPAKFFRGMTHGFTILILNQSKQWEHTNSRSAKTFKQMASVSKVMDSMF